MKRRYLKLLNFENSCKVIDFINTDDKNDYVNIIPRAIYMRVSDENWQDTETFIKSLNAINEIRVEQPMV